MSWRHYLVLGLLGLAATGAVAAFQRVPGYMDADYYYAGGLQLVEGRGFTEPYLWNYLDEPAGLPHPAFSYWMPLASLLAAAGAALFGPGSWSAARIGFLAVATAIPPVTAALAWSFAPRRELALTSGFLAVFSCFYLAYLPTTDTFGLYILLGGLFFLILRRRSSSCGALLLGMLAGLMHLARADGLLWLPMAWAAVFLAAGRRVSRAFLWRGLAVLAGYLLVMGPWFARNQAAFGSLLAPGGSRVLWLTRYDQLFAYPASQLTFSAWWQSGLAALIRTRLWALGLNLASLLSVQGAVFLLPLIAMGFWQLRRDGRIQVAGLAWLLLLGAMTVLFPLAGARGGYFHSGAALQALCWALAPMGLESLVAWAAQRRGWNLAQAAPVFRAALVCLAALLSGAIVYTRLLGGGGGQAWDRENAAYRRIDQFLVSRGAVPDSIVMVANPPGFYLASGKPAIAVPDADLRLLVTAAGQYRAAYLVLEQGSVPTGVLPVYASPHDQGCLVYLGEVEEARVYSFEACFPSQP
jgi:hypothetical protein